MTLASQFAEQQAIIKTQRLDRTPAVEALHVMKDHRLYQPHARSLALGGFAGSVAVHLAGWLGRYGEDTDVVSLLLGCFLSAGTALWLRFAAGGWARRWSSLRR